MARDLIVIMTGADPASFTLDVQIELPAHVRHELDESAALREHAARDQREAAARTRRAARWMHEQGMPLRDIGQVLGVSYQRAHQLVSEAEEVA